MFSFSPTIFFITLRLLLLFSFISQQFSLVLYIGQYTDDPKTIRRIAVESDDENTKSGMFQANYQYTPLKEYAAMKSDTNTNGYKSNLKSFHFFFLFYLRQYQHLT